MVRTHSNNCGNWSRTALSCSTIRPPLIIQASGPSSRRFLVSKPRKSPLLEPSPGQGQPVLIAGAKSPPRNIFRVPPARVLTTKNAGKRTAVVRSTVAPRLPPTKPPSGSVPQISDPANKKKLRPRNKSRSQDQDPRPRRKQGRNRRESNAGRPRGGASESSSRCWRSHFSSCGLQSEMERMQPNTPKPFKGNFRLSRQFPRAP